MQNYITNYHKINEKHCQQSPVRQIGIINDHILYMKTIIR